MGRRKLSPGERKVTLSTMLTENDYRVLEMVAGRVGGTVSSVARFLLHKSIVDMRDIRDNGGSLGDVVDYMNRNEPSTQV